MQINKNIVFLQIEFTIHISKKIRLCQKTSLSFKIKGEGGRDYENI